MGESFAPLNPFAPIVVFCLGETLFPIIVPELITDPWTE